MRQNRGFESMQACLCLLNIIFRAILSLSPSGLLQNRHMLEIGVNSVCLNIFLCLIQTLNATAMDKE